MYDYFKDIRQQMEAKGFTYIQQVDAYEEHEPFLNGGIPGQVYTFVLFGKQLGNVTILRICSSKYEYEIQPANRCVYTLKDNVYCRFDDVPSLDLYEDWQLIRCNSKFTNNKGDTFYFRNPCL